MWCDAAAMVMPGFEFLLVLLALIVDALTGDPRWRYQRVPHPVVMIGTPISALERYLNRGTPARRFVSGLLTTLVVAGAAAGAGYAVFVACRQLPHGWLVEALLASTLIAFRGLYDHVLAVATGLSSSLEDGRSAVANIVGRDPNSLDEAGVARAAIESLAENFSDGVVAPVFWFALLGLPGLVAYKAINTLDSMIGHRSERYENFGKFAARLDDTVNYLPARLAGCCFVLASVPLEGARVRNALRCMFRYAGQHRSPNAGWQEAAVAGALELALAGPRHYAEGPVDDAWMGDGRRELSAQDVYRALHLYLWAGATLAVLLATAWFLNG